jgi:hypothetical protein
VTVLISVLSAGLIVGCSSDHEGQGKKAPRSNDSTSVTSDQAKALELKAKKALGIAETDDADDLFVESGLERVGDGIHTRTTLTRGKSYTLAVACAGTGNVHLTVTAKPPARQTVECDSVPVRHRITNAPAQIEIDVEATAGSTGFVGWRIDELAG